MHENSLLLELALKSAWALEPTYLGKMFGVLARHASGERLSDVEIKTIAIGQTEKPGEEKCPYSLGPDGTATIQVHGVISKRASLIQNISGPSGKACETIKSEYAQCLADERCKRIVLDMETPGGDADGVADLADWIYQQRGKKPSTAFANGLMCSAGYWIASACSRVIVSQDALAGNIGVVAVIEDYSEALANKGIKNTQIKAGQYKGFGDPRFKTTQDTKDAVQEIVDCHYESFVQSVACSRGMKFATALKLADGRCHVGIEAVKCGLADAVGTFESVGGTCGMYPEACSPGVAAQAAEEMNMAENIAVRADTLQLSAAVRQEVQAVLPGVLAEAIKPLMAQLGADLRKDLDAMKADVEKTKTTLTESAQTASKTLKVKTFLSNHARLLKPTEIDETSPFGTLETSLLCLSDTNKARSYTDAKGVVHAGLSDLDIELARIACRKPEDFTEKAATELPKTVMVDGKTYIVAGLADDMTKPGAQLPTGQTGAAKDPLTGKTGKDRHKALVKLFADKFPKDAAAGLKDAAEFVTKGHAILDAMTTEAEMHDFTKNFARVL